MNGLHFVAPRLPLLQEIDYFAFYRPLLNIFLYVDVNYTCQDIEKNKRIPSGSRTCIIFYDLC